MKSRAIQAKVGALVLWALGVIACGKSTSPPAPTGVLDIVLESDMALPKDIDHVSLHVTQEGQSLLATESDVGPGALLLPATFGIKATSDSSPVTIHAVGYKSHQPRVERDAVTPIPVGHVGELRLALDYLCVGQVQTDADGGVSSSCPDGLTCVDGACMTSVVPPSAVTTVSPAPAASDDAGLGAGAPDGGSCFDVATCFASATAAVVDPTSCVVTLPAGTNPATVNLALQFPPGQSGVCGTGACWILAHRMDPERRAGRASGRRMQGRGGAGGLDRPEHDLRFPERRDAPVRAVVVGHNPVGGAAQQREHGGRLVQSRRRQAVVRPVRGPDAPLPERHLRRLGSVHGRGTVHARRHPELRLRRQPGVHGRLPVGHMRLPHGSTDLRRAGHLRVAGGHPHLRLVHQRLHQPAACQRAHELRRRSVRDPHVLVRSRLRRLQRRPDRRV